MEKKLAQILIDEAAKKRQEAPVDLAHVIGDVKKKMKKPSITKLVFFGSMKGSYSDKDFAFRGR